MAEKKDDEGKLKRLGGGRWQTPDERFTIEPQSGTWSLVDADQTDDLGLPLVRGPFRSLTEAKEAIASARSGAPAASPLAGRVDKSAAKTPSKTDGAKSAPGPSKPAGKAKAAAKKDEPEPEPRWIAELDPDDRRRARRLITRLEAIGAKDAEGIARRDVAGGVPTIARLAVADRLVAATGDSAAERLLADLLEVFVEGRDETLDVRWRLVDDNGRPIGLSRGDLDAARDRRKRRD